MKLHACLLQCLLTAIHDVGYTPTQLIIAVRNDDRIINVHLKTLARTYLLHGDVLIMQLKPAHHVFAAFDSLCMHSGIVEIACHTSEMNGFIMSTSALVKMHVTSYFNKQ